MNIEETLRINRLRNFRATRRAVMYSIFNRTPRQTRILELQIKELEIKLFKAGYEKKGNYWFKI